MDLILHEECDVVAPLEPRVAEQMGQAVAALIEFAIGLQFTGARHHHGGVVGPLDGMCSWVGHEGPLSLGPTGSGRLGRT